MNTIGTRNRAVPTHRHVSKEGVRRVFPDIKDDVCRGAIRYYDGQVDDARLVIALIRTAIDFGALAASRTEVSELLRDPSGRVVGAAVRDLETGTSHTITAQTVISATGVWTEQIQQRAGADHGRLPASQRAGRLDSRGRHARPSGQSGVGCRALSRRDRE